MHAASNDLFLGIVFAPRVLSFVESEREGRKRATVPSAPFEVMRNVAISGGADDARLCLGRRITPVGGEGGCIEVGF